ncbi:PEP-CTERM sorting domain-containing protein [Gloeothece verrucosa]|uniref:Uncharacterized protein n=1 Tax=Gloeothece verrucosa (strain PCC 7822) TaxID=497965 RepID=E0UBR3_GLOV7|nr:PEP-CTERM sorting domain-containing protein [Gloeothece verrucosa]ADN14007.1 hypothetical protein Cyan7822_2025 [Gloeothece verrucosa PCC 7822]
MKTKLIKTLFITIIALFSFSNLINSPAYALYIKNEGGGQPQPEPLPWPNPVPDPVPLPNPEPSPPSSLPDPVPLPFVPPQPPIPDPPNNQGNQQVPEPLTILGTITVLGSLPVFKKEYSKRKKSNKEKT